MNHNENKLNTSTVDADSVSKRTLIVAVIATIISTIGMLEFTGKIKHNEAKDDYSVSSYQAILIDPDEGELISRKPSDQTAQCIDGYLFIQSDTDRGMQGLIVDYKNRGVRCQTESL